MWHPDGNFADYDIERQKLWPIASAVALAPLLAGVATLEQAEASAEFIHRELLAP